MRGLAPPRGGCTLLFALSAACGAVDVARQGILRVPLDTRRGSCHLVQPLPRLVER